MNHHRLASARTATCVAILAVLTACGGGGADSSDDTTLEDLAQKKFQELEAAATELAAAETFLCVGDDCDVVKPSGDIVGRDLVKAIVDPNSVVNGEANLRIPATGSDADLPDLPAPQLPAEGFAVTPSVGAKALAVSALQPLSVKKENPYLKSQQVKVLVTFESKPGVIFQGSGTMIDSNWVITAGHVLFTDPNNPKHDSGKPFNPEYASSVSVVPAYGSSDALEPFGRYYAKKVLIREAFKTDALNQHDTGWIHLKNAIGGFTGYHIAASSNCNNYLNNDWFASGYPSEVAFSYPGFSNFDGKTQYTLKNYHMDKCSSESSESVTANFATFGGFSGSGATQFFSGADRVRAVQVASDRSTVTVFSKITPQVRNDTANMIKLDTPPTADLEPVHTRVATADNLPTVPAGSKQTLVTFIHNRSDTGSFFGSVDYEVYLSKNAYISGADTFIAKFSTASQTIAPKQTIADTPKITIPCRPLGVSPSTDLYIGIRILNSDARAGNNHSFDAAVRPVRISGTSCLS